MAHYSVDVRSALGGGGLNLQMFEVIQAVNRHELAHFKSTSVDTSLFRWKTGHPLHIRYGKVPHGSRSMPGYVVSGIPTVDQTRKFRGASFDVTASGATFPLKNVGRAVWQDIHGWEVVQRIARAFQLNARVDRVGSFFPVLRQDGRSFWEFLTDLADREGMLLYVDGTTIHYRHLPALEREQIPSAIPFTLNGNPRIQHLSTDMGQANPRGPANKRIAVVDRQGRQLAGKISAYNKTTSGNAGLLEESAITDELSSAQDELQALDRRNKPFHHTKALLDGDVRLRPGRGIFLEEVGSKMAGFWLVTRARHDFGESNNSYVTEVELRRSDVGARSRAVPIRASSGHVAIAGGHLGDPRTLTQERSRLLKGSWVSV